MIEIGTRVRVNMKAVRYGYAALCEALPGLENMVGTVTHIAPPVTAEIFDCQVTFSESRKSGFDFNELIEVFE